ncbi:MAG: acyl-CoA thioesterase [Fibrobacter sp.]|nr:acyl-CoA thioesterase [Fibrobacter sp.]
MDNYCLVRPEHLNHHNFLFGGQLLKWVDEYSWLAAACAYPKSVLVTRAMDNISFSHRVGCGAILRFNIEWKKQGYSSVTYETKVYATEFGESGEILIFSTNITFVSVDTEGNKMALPHRRCIV